MPDAPQVFFDHSRHKLRVEDVDTPLDVLSFDGKEWLSRPFCYHIEFTSAVRDIAAAHMLGQHARFSLFPPLPQLPFLNLVAPPRVPLRTFYGVVTGFKRLSGSLDESRYEVTLQPRLALLARGRAIPHFPAAVGTGNSRSHPA
ncbi:Rhs element Vgr protein [compost metagenome]